VEFELARVGVGGRRGWAARSPLGERVLRCPLLVISDGAAGLLAAIERTMPGCAASKQPAQPFTGGSAELAEELPHIADQQVGCLHGGEVTAAAELGPVHHVVVAFGEGPDGEVIGKHRHRSRYR
jgi:hypothetical protein